MKVIDTVRDAGLDSPAAWIVPPGPRLWVQAISRQEKLMEIDTCRQKISISATKFDTVGLEESLRQASELGVPLNQPAWAYKLFLDLQDVSFVLKKSNELQKLGTDQ